MTAAGQKTERLNEDPIWIVDEDKDDYELIKEAFRELKLPNQLEFFNDAQKVLKRMEEAEEAPFIILADVNLPKMNGFELREALLKTPNKKFQSVPFIFWSNGASERQIQRAYDLRCHGFFIKEATFEKWRSTFLDIVRYWTSSRTPSKTDQPTTPKL